MRTPVFHSVILAGVYDVRSIKRKIRPDGEHIENSPWNIAAKFNVDMSFRAEDIAGMLSEYEQDYHTGMDISMISDMIYACTSGYPYLVSALCKYMDEEVAGTGMFKDKKNAWTLEGFYEAERTATNDYMKDAVMLGFIRNENDNAVIFNQIFETVLYNYFISEEFASSRLYQAGVQEKNQFIIKGHLNEADHQWSWKL